MILSCVCSYISIIYKRSSACLFFGTFVVFLQFIIFGSTYFFFTSCFNYSSSSFPWYNKLELTFNQNPKTNIPKLTFGNENEIPTTMSTSQPPTISSIPALHAFDSHATTWQSYRDRISFYFQANRIYSDEDKYLTGLFPLR